MNQELFKELAFKAGFTGSDLHNTQFGTSYEHALKNFMELIVEECATVAQRSDLTMAIGQWGSHSAIRKHFNI